MKGINLAVFVLVTVLVAVAPQSLGAQSRWVAFSSGAPFLRLDTTTIDVRDGRTYAVWIEVRYTRSQTTSDPKRPMWSYMARIVVDCASKRFKTVRIVRYTADGQVISSQDHDEATVDWVLPVPDTVGEEYLSVCRRLEPTSARLPAERRRPPGPEAAAIQAGKSSPWNWIVISNTDTHPEIDLDVGSMRATARGVSAWTRWEGMPNERTPTGKPYSRLISRVIVNCADEASARVATYYYGADERVLDSSSIPPDQWHLESIVPDSDRAVEVREVCLEAKRKKLVK